MGRTSTALTAFGAGLLLAGCSQAAEPSDAPDAPAEAAAATTQTAPVSDNCVIEVDGRTWLDRACPYEVSDHLIILNIRPADGEDFVYLERDTANEAIANWSGGGGGGHAHSSLGTLRREGVCWVSDRARICLPREAAAEFDRASQ